MTKARGYGAIIITNICWFITTYWSLMSIFSKYRTSEGQLFRVNKKYHSNWLSKSNECDNIVIISVFFCSGAPDHFLGFKATSERSKLSTYLKYRRSEHIGLSTFFNLARSENSYMSTILGIIHPVLRITSWILSEIIIWSDEL